MMFLCDTPTLTLPLKGEGTTPMTSAFSFPLEGEGRDGGAALPDPAAVGGLYVNGSETARG